jgi:hypothetical protein
LELFGHQKSRLGMANPTRNSLQLQIQGGAPINCDLMTTFSPIFSLPIYMYTNLKLQGCQMPTGSILYFNFKTNKANLKLLYSDKKVPMYEIIE